MLGSQLGIATDNLGKFTDTVAKFSSITGVSIDTTATTFGKLSNLLKLSAADYDNLGSSIAYVGVNAAATETDILSASRQIAAVSTAAGLSSSDVIGLASALSSLGTAPEEARGVLVPTFNAMDSAIRSFNASTGTGDDSLKVFAATAGMTAKEFVDAWGDKKNGGATQAFKNFIAGLGQGNTSKILNQLALDGVRTSKGLTALGQNAQVAFQQMDDAATGMVMGDYLDKSFAKTVDDISVRLQLLGAAVQEMFATMAGSEHILGAIGAGIDALKGIISGASDAMKGPFTSAIAGVILAITGLIGILLGVGSAVAIGIASLYALRVAVNQLGNDAMFSNSKLLAFVGGLSLIHI
jgi:TP901 family phage tail tape measure protein